MSLFSHVFSQTCFSSSTYIQIVDNFALPALQSTYLHFFLTQNALQLAYLDGRLVVPVRVSLVHLLQHLHVAVFFLIICCGRGILISFLRMKIVRQWDASLTWSTLLILTIASANWDLYARLMRSKSFACAVLIADNRSFIRPYLDHIFQTNKFICWLRRLYSQLLTNHIYISTHFSFRLKSIWFWIDVCANLRSCFTTLISFTNAILTTAIEGINVQNRMKTHNSKPTSQSFSRFSVALLRDMISLSLVCVVLSDE